MIKRLTRREQRIFVVCMAVIFVYIGYNALIKPLRDKITSVDGEIRTYQKSMDKSVSAVVKSKELRQQYNEYLSRFKQFKTDEQVMASMLLEIEKVSGKFGLLISELKSKKVKHDKHYNRFSVSLTKSIALRDLSKLHTPIGHCVLVFVLNAPPLACARIQNNKKKRKKCDFVNEKFAKKS